LQHWADALAFYSEEDPLGVVGSYLLDKLSSTPEYYHFKHHYILHALESEILEDLLIAIDKKLQVKIHIFNPKKGSPTSHAVTPLRIVISTQGGRRYLMAHSHSSRRINLFRLDTIRKVELCETDEYFNDYLDQSYKFIENMWGVSSGFDIHLDHIEFTVHVEQDEKHIVERLYREKRCGQVMPVGDNLYRFSADVYDAAEMLPWIRTFIGRIVSFDSSNDYTRSTFLKDLDVMCSMYPGGEVDVVS